MVCPSVALLFLAVNHQAASAVSESEDDGLLQHALHQDVAKLKEDKSHVADEIRHQDAAGAMITKHSAIEDEELVAQLAIDEKIITDVNSAKSRLDDLSWHEVESAKMNSTTEGTVQITSGPCKASGDCVMSPNYPGLYSDRQDCSFTMSKRAISVEKFNTEKNWDKLYVNGVAYSGSNGPESVVPTRTITWNSDGSVVRPGWKICTPFQPIYLGCYGDDSKRAFAVNWGDPIPIFDWFPMHMRGIQAMVGRRVGKHGNVLQKCQANCETVSQFFLYDWPKAPTRYMAIQNGDECFCGNSYDSHGPYAKKPDADCDSTSQGCRYTHKCGGPWRNAIYLINEDTESDR